MLTTYYRFSREWKSDYETRLQQKRLHASLERELPADTECVPGVAVALVYARRQAMKQTVRGTES